MVKTIRAITKALFSDHLLVQYSWIGTSNKGKFSGFKHIHDTLTAVVRYKFENYTDDAHASFFKVYLKHRKG